MSANPKPRQPRTTNCVDYLSHQIEDFTIVNVSCYFFFFVVDFPRIFRLGFLDVVGEPLAPETYPYPRLAPAALLRKPTTLKENENHRTFRCSASRQAFARRLKDADILLTELANAKRHSRSSGLRGASSLLTLDSQHVLLRRSVVG